MIDMFIRMLTYCLTTDADNYPNKISANDK